MTRTGWTLAAVATALFCVQIDYFALNLALPRIAADFGGTTTDLQWVISIYMLALGAFMVPAGRVGDMFGRRRALLAGIAMFGVASVACALAPSVELLVAFRAVQGIGAAFIFPVSVSVLTNAFPPERSSRAIGLAYGIAGLGNAAGPLVGGLLTETLGWRAVFWLNIPFVAVSLVIGLLTIAESSDDDAPRRIDLAGLATITAGIGLFTLAFDRAPAWGWLSVPTVGVLAGSIVLLAAFAAVEKRVASPLLDLSLFAAPRFVILVTAGTVANVGYAVTIFLSTLNLQQGRGLDPLTAGAVFLGPSIGAAVGGALSGRLAERRPVVVMGVATAAASIAMAALALAVSWAVYLPALTACGFTLGLVYAFTTVATQTVVPPERAGEAAGVTLTALVTVGGVGVAVAGTALEMLQHGGMDDGAAVGKILLAVAALLLPAGLAVLAVARRTTASRPAGADGSG